MPVAKIASIIAKKRAVDIAKKKVAKVSASQASKVAREQMKNVGKKPGRKISKRTGLSQYEKEMVQKKFPVERREFGRARKPEDVRRGRAIEKEQLRKSLQPPAKRAVTKGKVTNKAERERQKGTPKEQGLYEREFGVNYKLRDEMDKRAIKIAEMKRKVAKSEWEKQVRDSILNPEKPTVKGIKSKIDVLGNQRIMNPSKKIIDPTSIAAQERARKILIQELKRKGGGKR
jgi:hypothetical protein